MKRLIVFDLDGTLAQSKASLDAEMGTLLGHLLEVVHERILERPILEQHRKMWAESLDQARRNDRVIEVAQRFTKNGLLPVLRRRRAAYFIGHHEPLVGADVAASLDALTAHASVVGIREVVRWHPDPPGVRA